MAPKYEQIHLSRTPWFLRGVYREHLARYEFAAAWVSGLRVLDVACGVGYGSAFLAGAADTVAGVDISAEAIVIARSEFAKPNVEFFQGSATELPFKDDTFDMAVSFETIEHLPPNLVPEFLKELQRVVKAGAS